ncbi:glycosyltransferase family 2 protein [Branchiibius sp. NY16-3462-2]|uniref:glycosyltransferase family 2 protein n=1 Tax=Branchiibius sp. NY16-3462-2 TaxID=1807500 RepID=UPI0007935D27|nr:glycosyltransferase family 2 protein [Branchiibius sp. NY16-3462-2]KYH43582.1 hypothetical protein AZH51_03760 [Branchiibius sp. NY16-3462-2]
MSNPLVSVVVPYYNAPQRLERLVAGLRLQTLPTEQFEVIVADDGSPQPPRIEWDGLTGQVVRQPRRGFRAAAARNLGLRTAMGQVVCFLDADLVPARDYLEQMLHATTPRSVVVGTRRHVDLTDWAGDEVRDWLRGDGQPPPQLTDPEWLAQGYRDTDDLRAADDLSFRFVISAVMSVDRQFLCSIGGFDESFVAYGGEDWELAQRCWLAGATLRHLPEAVAWHDGPDIAGRPDDLVTLKNYETAHLATRLTHPAIRGNGLVHAIPDVVIEADVGDWTLGQVLVAVPSWLGSNDAGVWFGGSADEASLRALGGDPRVHAGEPPQEVVDRCRFRVRIHEPVQLTMPWLDAIASMGARGGHAVTVQHTRDRAIFGAGRKTAVLKERATLPVVAQVVAERARASAS